MHRANLCELLWENTPEPRAALRWCLSRLRPVLDAGGVSRLATEGETIWIETGSCEIDGKTIQNLALRAAEAETGDLENAVTRFAGSFLADLEINDAFRFESWKASEEKSLAKSRSIVFAELLRRHDASPESKIRLAHIWVQQDPFDSQPHIAILEALTALGRKREALEHFERCTRMLKRHGVDPHPNLEKARRAIGQVGGEQAGKAPEKFPPSHTVRPPMAGREMEMEKFLNLLTASSQAPDGKLHLLSGEPGIGKTRLLFAMEDQLTAKGWILMRGRAFEAERGRAFGPWIDAARTIATERADSGGPLLRPSSLPEGGLDPTALFEAVKDWLRELSKSAPLALIFDDLHWLDSSSLALLQYLIRDPDRPFRLMLGSLRSVASPQDKNVEAFLRLLQREGWSETWDIGPLSAEGTADLLRLVGSPRDPGAVHAQSAGHPLASIALALEGHAENRGVLDSLEAMLDERIRMAGETGRDILQWASLLGRGLPPALMETLLDLPVHTLLASLELLETQGLMQVMEGEAGMEYLFGHDLIRQRAQTSLSTPRRVRMHAHVADILKQNPSLRRGWEEVAHHAELGEQWEWAAIACLEASQHCFRLRAFEAVEKLVESGLDHLDKLADHWALQREFCLMTTRVVHCMGRLHKSMETRLNRLIRKAKEQAQQETLMAALYAMATVRYVQNQPEDLRAAALQMQDAVSGIEDPVARAFSLSGMALCLIATDQEIPRAMQLIRDAERICVEHEMDEADTRTSQGWLAHREGRLDEARSHLVKAQLLMQEKNLPHFEHQIYCSLTRLELEEGAPVEALACAEKMRALEDVVQQSADRHFPDALSSLAYRLLGKPDAGAKFILSLERLRADHCKVITSYLLLFWSELDLRAGLLKEIPERCREAIERCEPLNRITEPTWARCLLGLTALKAGEKAEALAHWEKIQLALKSTNPLPARISGLVKELALGLGLAI